MQCAPEALINKAVLEYHDLNLEETALKLTISAKNDKGQDPERRKVAWRILYVGAISLRSVFLFITDFPTSNDTTQRRNDCNERIVRDVYFFNFITRGSYLSTSLSFKLSRGRASFLLTETHVWNFQINPLYLRSHTRYSAKTRSTHIYIRTYTSFAIWYLKVIGQQIDRNVIK